MLKIDMVMTSRYLGQGLSKIIEEIKSRTDSETTWKRISPMPKADVFLIRSK
jgi:hypothetical protein